MKPKIILVNKFYYRRGGDCVCTLNLERLLTEQGHETAVFAMKYHENIPSRWSSYWPDEIDFGGNVTDRINALKRTLGYGDIKPKFAALLNDFKPDVVHLNNIHSYLSPILAEMAHNAGAKVVWTLHDYKLLCPSYSCLDPNGRICEKCFNNKSAVFFTRCMKGSFAASAAAWAEALKWNRKRLQKYVDTFICPSEFINGKMKQGGFTPAKLRTLCNFASPEMLEALKTTNPEMRNGDYCCYVGRLSHEKGIKTLLEAAATLPYRLKVAGVGPLREELEKQYAGYGNIEFLGHLDGAGVRDLLSNARFSVIPSEWYENNPLGVIESLCAGTPVVGARIGGIPELINGAPGRGRVYEPGNKSELAEAIKRQWDEQAGYSAIKAKATNEFSPAAHYRQLMEIYAR